MSLQIHPPRILKVSCGAIAQLGERVTGSHEVGGSIPPSSTNFLFNKPGTACQLQIFSKVRMGEDRMVGGAIES